MRQYLDGELWIPCNEKLPERFHTQKVWLSFSNEYGSHVRKGIWESNCFKWENGRVIKDKPDAWMPYCVPKPYKPKGEQ